MEKYLLVSGILNFALVCLLWMVATRAEQLKERNENLEDVVDRKQERYDELRERFNKLSSMKDDVFVEKLEEVTKEEKKSPKHLWVFYSRTESFGVAVDEGSIKDGSVYRKFIKWFYSTEKPTFTFHYSNGTSTTIMRNLITHFEVK